VPDDAVFGVTVEFVIDVELVIDDAGFVTTVVPPEIFGKFGIGAIFNEIHVDCNRFLIRPYSLESMDRLQRTFTAIQLPKYVHVYDCSGGNQFEGSLSLFD
jgi:hypothetical protein